ncbi:hypothetical protein BofuT4_P007150.1 [Botrytis cinerea T4]|uniref:Uncharacterized protein n=1 Tax=Botryotinia fuckeliana (strain T4) TaxID=999810 RepID=G2Y4G6_BOTF4|nr:hypothetical protein BofuT4_P007150.1 [Botrytis cinerea T4]
MPMLALKSKSHITAQHSTAQHSTNHFTIEPSLPSFSQGYTRYIRYGTAPKLERQLNSSGEPMSFKAEMWMSTTIFPGRSSSKRHRGWVSHMGNYHELGFSVLSDNHFWL